MKGVYILPLLLSLVGQPNIFLIHYIMFFEGGFLVSVIYVTNCVLHKLFVIVNIKTIRRLYRRQREGQLGLDLCDERDGRPSLKLGSRVG